VCSSTPDPIFSAKPVNTDAPPAAAGMRKAALTNIATGAPHTRKMQRRLEPCVHRKRSLQLFPHVDLGPRQDPLAGPADGPICAQPQEYLTDISSQPAATDPRPRGGGDRNQVDYLVDCDGVHDKVRDYPRVCSPPPPPDETVNLHPPLSSMKERVST
jgi:hypothetical protein